MNVTRDVVNDLLPLYSAGEASPDTVALVEEFIRRHPDMAGALEALSLDSLPEISLQLNPNKEKETLNMTRKLLRVRGTLMGVAIFLTMLPFAVRGSNGQIVWGMLRDAPAPVLGLLFVAIVAAWGGFFYVGRRLRHTGL